MKKDLVDVQGRKPVTTSLIIAERFRKSHKNVLRDIKNLIKEAENSGSGRLKIEQSFYVNSQNKKQPMYFLDREAFSLLVMGFTGSEAFKWKRKFYRAFELMEKRLHQIDLERATTEWQIARLKGKLQRRKETDTVKDFILYAEEQGSSNAKYYYVHFTRMVHKALGVKDGERDKLTDEALSFLASLESVVEIELPILMSEGIFYKDILKRVRSKVKAFVRAKGLPETVYLPKEEPQLELIDGSVEVVG